jgi:hypothetical protein
MTTTDSHLWLWGGPPHDSPEFEAFLYNPKRNCIDKREYFFSDDPEYQVIAMNLCRTCPMFRACTRWTLANFLHLPHGIFAMMSEETRSRIYYGKRRYRDPRPGFNYAKKRARAAAHKREQSGVRKRDQRRAEIPPCPGCGSNQYVVREGRCRITNRQEYKCMACGPYFPGEEL